MSKYTTELRFICENFAKLDDSATPDEIVQAAIPKIFNFNYPLFDPSYKNVLETKIVKHFYFREIGFETVGLWKFKLAAKMNEIMPYFNRLYVMETEGFNIFDNVHLKTTRLGEEKGLKHETGSDTESVTDTGKDVEIGETATNVNNKSVGETNHNANNFDKYSDTPQGGLSGVSQGTYLTNARNVIEDSDDHSTVTDTGSTQVNSTNTTDKNNSRDRDSSNTVDTNFINTEDWAEMVVGKNGGESYLDMFQKLCGKIIDVDLMVLDKLSDLFMLVW